MARLFGSSDFISPEIDINVGDGFSFWLKTTQTGTLIEILGRHFSSTSASGFGLVMSSGTLSLYIKPSGSGVGESTIINDGAWHHIFLNMGFTGGCPLALWIDGALGGSSTNGALAGGANEALRLGRSNDSFWAGFVGEIAEFGYWGSAGNGAEQLTTDQITALAKGFRPPTVKRKGLVGYLPLVRDVVNPGCVFNQVPSVTGTSVTDHPRMIG